MERRPGLVVAGIVAAAWLLVGALALGAPAPRIFPDELIYMDAAGAAAGGEQLSVRGDEYGYGPVYPLLVAPLLALAPDREVGLALVQALNALAFALVAVPTYLLARMLMRPGPALLAGGLAVLVPSSVYAAGVLTESLAYLACAVALLLVVRTVVSPTFVHQLAAVATIAVAAGVRTQLAILAPVAVAVYLTAWALLPRTERPRPVAYWPTAASVLAGVVALGLALSSGRSPADLLGSYGVLWGSYPVGEVGRWAFDHAGLLAVYVGVIPAVVAPVVGARWHRAARAGGRPEAALLATLVLATVAMLVVVALFASTTYAGGVLHDRSLFYLAPLWLTVLCAWLADGMPRTVSALAVGVVVTLALVATVPYAAGPETAVWETLAFEPWQFVERGNPAGTPFSGREGLFLFAALGALAACAVPRPSRWVVAAFVGAFLAFTGSLAWAHAREGARSVDARAFRPGDERAWVDALTSRDTALLSVTAACETEVAEASGRLTEFFNDAVGEVAYVGRPDPLGPPATRVRLVALGGGASRLVREDGRPFSAEVLVTRAGVPVRGTRLGAGTRAPLVAWAVGGPVTLDVGSRAELVAGACAPGT